MSASARTPSAPPPRSDPPAAQAEPIPNDLFSESSVPPTPPTPSPVSSVPSPVSSVPSPVSVRRRSSGKASWGLFNRPHSHPSAHPHPHPHPPPPLPVAADSPSPAQSPLLAQSKIEKFRQYEKLAEYQQQFHPSPLSSPTAPSHRVVVASPNNNSVPNSNRSSQYDMSTSTKSTDGPVAPPHADGTINSSQSDLSSLVAPVIPPEATATLPPIPTSGDPQEIIKKLEERLQKAQEDHRRLLEETKSYMHKDYRERLTYNNTQHEKKFNELHANYQQVADTSTALYQQNEDLHQKLAVVSSKLQQREIDYAKIESNFLEYMKIIRPTDDDLSTIRDRFKTLKYTINRLLLSLNKKADRGAATVLLTASWDNLQESVRSLGAPLDNFYINMLMEKLIMDTLVKYVFNVTLYVGLPVNEAYATVKNWMDLRNPQWSVRLRQQLCSLVANPKDIETHEAIQTEKTRIVDLIYGHLVTSYPFIGEKNKADAAAAAAAGGGREKGYYAKVEEIVDKAVYLSLAIRGQDVEIMTIHVREGEELFDPERMTLEQKSKSSGVVKFCICPPFQGGDGEHGFLEKGKVFCG